MPASFNGVMKLLLLALLSFTGLWAAETPTTGDMAPGFTLRGLDGKPHTLAESTAKGPVVLVVLRGFPGYQCPLCNRQVSEFVRHGAAFAQAGARVVMIYPGPGAMLEEKAQEFAADKALPAHYSLLLDPDYQFTVQYNLRWDAPKETAYPSTFLIDRNGKVVFAKVSRSHGGRTTAAEMLAELAKLRM